MKVSAAMKRMAVFGTIGMILALSASSALGAVKSHYRYPDKSTQASVVKAPAFLLPKGAVVVSEINLNEDNILGMLKQAIPAFASGVSAASGPIVQEVKRLNLNQLYDAVKGVKAVRLTHFKTSGEMGFAQTFAFMEKQVPESKGWQRILYSTEFANAIEDHFQGEDLPTRESRQRRHGNGVVAIYARGKDFLGIMLSSNGRTGVSFGSAGFVDVPKLSNWIGHNIAILSDSDEEKPEPVPVYHHVVSGNMLKNPSFEEGLTGWINTSSQAYSIDCAYPKPYDGPRDGANWVGNALNGASGIREPELRQVVNVTPGTKYILSVWVFTAGSPKTCSSYLQCMDGVATADGQCTTISSSIGNTPEVNGGWQRLTGTVTPVSSQITYCLKLSWDSSERGGGGDFDLAEMYPAPQK